MDINIILKLIDAGYTKAEIQAMEACVEDPAPAEDPKPTEDPAPAPAEDPKPAPAEDAKPAPDPGAQVWDGIQEQLKLLRETLQASNMRHDEQPPRMTVKDIQAEIIAPHRKNN